MARGRQRRQPYNQVSSEEHDSLNQQHVVADTNVDNEASATAAASRTNTIANEGAGPEAPRTSSSSSGRVGRGRTTRRQYSPLSIEDQEEQEGSVASSLNNGETATTTNDDDDTIVVTLLDLRQTKFRVTAHKSWTVLKLKQDSQEVHKVAVPQQRLVYRGKLLQDEQTLQEAGITNNCIVHLFPKPRVVITSSEEASTSTTADGTENEEDSVGARVPTIVLDADEAERRGTILVLGSPEYIEAQNNVKLFSFMLFIISSIELLNLLAIALGAPQQEQGIPMNTEDDIFATDDELMPSNNTTSPQDPLLVYQEWSWPNNIDLIISIMGVYVAMLGIKATNENTLRLAKQYLLGTVVVGIGWMLFNFFMSVQIDEAVEEAREERDDDYFADMTDKDIYNQSLSVMVLPGLLWVMCCVRAFQFQYLLHEAEQEAEERIRRDAELVTDVEQGGSTTGASPASAPVVQHDEELAVQNESATIS